MKGLIRVTIFSVFAFAPAMALAASVTANSTLSRGTQISSGDISVEAESGENPQDIISHYVGKELTRTIYSGTEIRDRDVQEPLLVKRNSPVTMIYRVGRLEISTNGRALS